MFKQLGSVIRLLPACNEVFAIDLATTAFASAVAAFVRAVEAFEQDTFTNHTGCSRDNRFYLHSLMYYDELLKISSIFYDYSDFINSVRQKHQVHA